MDAGMTDRVGVVTQRGDVLHTGWIVCLEWFLVRRRMLVVFGLRVVGMRL